MFTTFETANPLAYLLGYNRRPLKNRPHLGFYTSGKFFQKISATAAKNLMPIDQLNWPFPHFATHGIRDRRDFQGRMNFIGLDLGFYPTALGRIFIPLNTLKAACLNQASRLFFMMVVNRARLAWS